MSAEAGIVVTVTTAAGHVDAVSVVSSRRPLAGRLFSGKAPATIVPMIPVLFSLCGTAQAVAGLRAMERAAGRPAAAAHDTARAVLVAAETVAEHGLTIARDWPALLDQPPRLEAAKALRAAGQSLRAALYPAGDWLSLGGGRLRPDDSALATARAGMRQAAAAIAACPPAALADLTGFRHWLDGAGAATLPGRIWADGWAASGVIALHPMPPAGPADVEARLSGADSLAYQTRPDCAGQVYETGVLAQTHHHPLIAALVQCHGAGLLARLAARLVALAAALDCLDQAITRLQPADAAGGEMGDGSGLAQIHTARGLLIQRAVLAGGTIADYQIVAPTEWNFHPAGPMVAALRGLEANAQLERRARLLLQAFDPCVAYTLSIETAHA